MALPHPVLDFLYERARRGGANIPKNNDDLFKLRILDSFALIEFLLILEEHCGIKVPDSDVLPENFQTIEIIDRFAAARWAHSP